MYTDLAALGEDPQKIVPALTHIWRAVNGTQASNTRQNCNNEGILIFLFVVYAGEDQAARQASSMISRDSFAQDLMKENFVDIRKVLNGVADTIWCVSFASGFLFFIHSTFAI